tara:strand:+ start:13865 stop:14335 length:471 start_codon:yes stop_codon:yes gene_type:complete
MSNFENADGLYVQYGNQDVDNQTGTSIATVKHFRVGVQDATDIGAADVDPRPDEAFIPAGSYIKSAYLLVDTAFTSGGSATLDVGLQELDGTVIDADGLDAAIALTALNATTKAVAMDGALVGGATKLSADAYISLKRNVAAFTAGAATLVVEYIK